MTAELKLATSYLYGSLLVCPKVCLKKNASDNILKGDPLIYAYYEMEAEQTTEVNDADLLEGYPFKEHPFDISHMFNPLDPQILFENASDITSEPGSSVNSYSSTYSSG